LAAPQATQQRCELGRIVGEAMEMVLASSAPNGVSPEAVSGLA